MWFLGAGASASAGIPTAGDMIWDFKRQLFISQRGAETKAVADLSNSIIRSKLQAHIDSSGTLPAAGAPDEYAALFEAVWPSEVDRRTYIDSKVAGGKPSYGHIALATLMRAGRARIVWTTNFDPLVADGCATVYGGTGQLAIATPDAPDLAATSILNERWPLEVKLHGDFRSRRLKNTGDELRHQDQNLRQLLIECSRRFGLIIVGYSGRDDSIMDALEEAVRAENPFPAGLFWLHRGDDDPLPRVVRILQLASHKMGKESGLVRIVNFDEALRDIVRIIKDIDTTALDAFLGERKRRTGAPIPKGRTGWPSVRLNALPMQAPSVCRRVVCTVGGYAEARAAVKQANVDVLVAPRRGAVLAYGSDADVRAAFAPFNITDFDLYTIEMQRLRYDSAERGLLREGVTRALARVSGMDAIYGRTTNLLAPSDPSNPAWSNLRKLVATISGTVPKAQDINWREGLGIRLDWADDRLWLLFEPRIVFTGVTQENRHAASDFGRERTVKRYNRQLNDILDFWAGFLSGKSPISALGISTGVDAAFTIESETAVSSRVTP